MVGDTRGTMRATDPAAIERLLLYIYAQAHALQRELEALAGDLQAEEIDRFEGTLAYIRTESSALLFAMPERVTH